jgi:hypothetical protein
MIAVLCTIFIIMTVMSVPSDPQAAALLAHVVSQLHQNVEFLASQNYISASDASAILAKLPAGPTGTDSIPQRPEPGITKARALWPYNDNGEVITSCPYAAYSTPLNSSRIPTIFLSLKEISLKSYPNRMRTGGWVKPMADRRFSRLVMSNHSMIRQLRTRAANRHGISRSQLHTMARIHHPQLVSILSACSLK